MRLAIVFIENENYFRCMVLLKDTTWILYDELDEDIEWMKSNDMERRSALKYQTDGYGVIYVHTNRMV